MGMDASLVGMLNALPLGAGKQLTAAAGLRDRSDSAFEPSRSPGTPTPPAASSSLQSKPSFGTGNSPHWLCPIYALRVTLPPLHLMSIYASCTVLHCENWEQADNVCTSRVRRQGLHQQYTKALLNHQQSTFAVAKWHDVVWLVAELWPSMAVYSPVRPSPAQLQPPRSPFVPPLLLPTDSASQLHAPASGDAAAKLLASAADKALAAAPAEQRSASREAQPTSWATFGEAKASAATWPSLGTETSDPAHLWSMPSSTLLVPRRRPPAPPPQQS